MKASFFAPLHKVEENDDGTLKVTGIASSEATDAAGEVVTADAMKAALPDFMKFGTGALREMHQLSAAGTVDEAEVDGDKTYIAATVVDPIAIEKVRKGVYKGFSIGGRVTKREKNVIKGLSLTEISLVDSPCNPEARFSVWKADSNESVMARKNTKPAPGAPAGEEVEKTEQVEMTEAEGAEVDKAEQTEAVTEPEAAEPDDAATKALAAADKLASAVAEAKDAADLKKGMYDVGEFARLLVNVAYLMKSADWEAEDEGDNSPVPGALRGWLADGVSIFKSMAAEETSELLASTAKAAEAAGLAKAAAEPADGGTTAAAPDALAKAEAAADDLRKALAKSDAALDAITAKIEPLVAEVQSLRKRFEDEPLPPKTAKTHAVAKSADAAGEDSVAAPAADAATEEAVAKAIAQMDPQERAMLMMKAAHQFPRSMTHRA